MKGRDDHSNDKVGDESMRLMKDSEIDVQISTLSGDEAVEQNYMGSSMHASQWNKGAKAGFFWTVITIMKSNIGVGILGMPNVGKNFGLVPMILILLVFHSITLFTIRLLIRCKNLSHHSNYCSIGYYIFRTRLILNIISIIIIINNFGLTLAEMIIKRVFATTSSNVISLFIDDGSNPFYASKWFLSLMIAIIVFPLTLLKEIEKLKFVSILGMASITVFTIVITINFFKVVTDGGPADGFGVLYPSEFVFSKAFGCLPTVIMAYQWQFNFFPIYKGMRQPNDVNIIRCCHHGQIYVSIFYIAMGSMGYATYGANVEANFMGIIQKDEIGMAMFLILNICYIFQTAFMMPIMFLGARNNLVQLMKPRANTSDDHEDQRQRLVTSKEKLQWKFVIQTFVLWAVMTAGAISLDSLEIAFNLIGSISSNAIGVVLPCIFYLKLSGNHGNLYRFVRIMAIIAVILTFVCLASETIKLLNE